MVEVVNETCVLTQACFCLKKYPPHLDGKLFEVLEREGYHLGVLEKPPDFQKDSTSPHHFMGIFVWCQFIHLKRANHVHLFYLESLIFQIL